jgi:hypothetical protein
MYMEHGMRVSRSHVQNWRLIMNKLRELIDEPGFVLMILGFIFLMTLILTTPACADGDRRITMKDIKKQQGDLIVEHCTATTIGIFILDSDIACILVNLYAMQRVLSLYVDLSFAHFDNPNDDYSDLKRLKQLMTMNGRGIGDEQSFDYITILTAYERYLESRKSK